ncbi:MAG: hypothetical protein ACE5GS_04965 [Kiloniellaceae bacterium]
MILRRRSRFLVPGALLAAGLGIAWLLYEDIRAGPQPPPLEGDAGVQAPPLPELPSEAGFTMPPAKTFVEILRRPIFSPTRRPSPQGEVTLEAAGSELDLKLVGIIISSRERIAIVAPRNSSTFVRLSQGDRFQGWTVELIEPHRVTFRRDDVAEQIELSYDQPPPIRRKPPKRRDQEQEAEQKPKE